MWSMTTRARLFVMDLRCFRIFGVNMPVLDCGKTHLLLRAGFRVLFHAKWDKTGIGFVESFACFVAAASPS